MKESIIGPAVIVIAVAGFLVSEAPDVTVLAYDAIGGKAIEGHLVAKLVGVGLAAVIAILLAAFAVAHESKSARAGIITLIGTILAAGLAILTAGSESESDPRELDTALYIFVAMAIVFLGPLCFSAMRQGSVVFHYYAGIGMIALAGLLVGALVQFGALFLLWPDGVHTDGAVHVVAPWAAIATTATWGSAIWFWLLLPETTAKNAIGRTWTLAGLAAAALFSLGYGYLVYGQRDWLIVEPLPGVLAPLKWPVWRKAELWLQRQQGVRIPLHGLEGDAEAIVAAVERYRPVLRGD